MKNIFNIIYNQIIDKKRKECYKTFLPSLKNMNDEIINEKINSEIFENAVEETMEDLKKLDPEAYCDEVENQGFKYGEPRE